MDTQDNRRPAPESSDAKLLSCETERYLSEAAEHVARALQHLDSAPAQGLAPLEPKAREELKVRLWIQFLFPQLSDTQQQWLQALFWERHALVRLFNYPPHRLPHSLRSQTESATRQLEQLFMELVARARILTSDTRFSAVQQAILEREFYHIAFP